MYGHLVNCVDIDIEHTCVETRVCLIYGIFHNCEQVHVVKNSIKKPIGLICAVVKNCTKCVLPIYGVVAVKRDLAHIINIF